MKAIRIAGLAVAPAALSWLVPGLPEAFLYDRAAILEGEAWRLVTGHWVHFSTSHLAWNSAGLLGAGLWLERGQAGTLGRFLALAAPLLGLSFLVGAPAMLRYGGLSGLATGAVVLLALVERKRNRPARGWWTAVLALVAIKLGLDAIGPEPVFASFGAAAVRTSFFAHGMGAVAGAAFFLLDRRLRKDERRQPRCPDADLPRCLP